MPVDAGRAGHSPVGQVAKLRDWVFGRDKDSDDSVAAYHRLAHDIITAIPEEFGPAPVSADMMDWFWRHNAWRGVFNNPLPRRDATPGQLDTATLPVAMFDDGDQHHHGGRALPLRFIAAGHRLPWPRRRCWPGQPASDASPHGAKPCGYPAPTAATPTATKPSCPSSTCPRPASFFPAQNFCKPSTTSTPAPLSTSPSTSSR